MCIWGNSGGISQIGARMNSMLYPVEEDVELFDGRSRLVGGANRAQSLTSCVRGKICCMK